MKATDYLSIYAACLSTMVFLWNIYQSRANNAGMTAFEKSVTVRAPKEMIWGQVEKGSVWLLLTQQKSCQIRLTPRVVGI
jgi:hypothetical protein